VTVTYIKPCMVRPLQACTTFLSYRKRGCGSGVYVPSPPPLWNVMCQALACRTERSGEGCGDVCRLCQSTSSPTETGKVVVTMQAEAIMSNRIPRVEIAFLPGFTCAHTQDSGSRQPSEQLGVHHHNEANACAHTIACLSMCVKPGPMTPQSTD